MARRSWYCCLSSCNPFKHVALGRGLRAQVHSDGAPCWPKIVKGMKKNSVRSFRVKQNKMEFVKKVKKGAGHILTGIQCIDRFWQSVHSYILPSGHSKHGVTANPRLLMCLYSYICRSQVPKRQTSPSIWLRSAEKATSRTA